MDYRNADGSIAQMCGNGVRVFAHYLRASGLEQRDEFVVGSLAGPRPVVLRDVDATCPPTSRWTWARPTSSAPDRPSSGGRTRSTDSRSTSEIPHLACVDASLTDGGPGRLDVAAPVSFDAAQFPEGVNVEVLTAPVDGGVTMRVHERGVGETRSCGTGTVAAAVAALRHQGAETGHAGGADPRRRGHRDDHRHHQLPARTVGTGGPRRAVRRLVARPAVKIRMRENHLEGAISLTT